MIVRLMIGHLWRSIVRGIGRSSFGHLSNGRSKIRQSSNGRPIIVRSMIGRLLRFVVKGTVSRDFRPSVFFGKQYPSGSPDSWAKAVLNINSYSRRYSIFELTPRYAA
jgi:hypothetical protein